MCYNRVVEEIEIEYYETDHEGCPFIEWLDSLTTVFRAQVRRRLGRIRVGNFGDCSSIKGAKGLYELRIHVGPGYRIYYGKRNQKVIILLCGGDKKSQRRDISKAAKYWSECLE